MKLSIYVSPPKESHNGRIIESPASFPLAKKPSHLLVPKSVKDLRRVSIDVIDTSKLHLYKSPEEEEEERLEALAEINVFTEPDYTKEAKKLIDLVLKLVSKVVQSDLVAITLLGQGSTHWDIASVGVTGAEIPHDVLCEVLDSHSVIVLDTNDDNRFHDSLFGFYAGVALKHKNKSVGVVSILDVSSREDFADLSIEILDDACDVIIDRLLSFKSESQKRTQLMREVEEQKRLLEIQDDLRRRERSFSPSPSPRQSLIDLEDAYMGWADDDLATGDQISHLTWLVPWQQSYPQPPVATNDKERSQAAEFYRSIVEDPTKIMFNEMCSTVCKALGFPMAVLGIITDNNYFPEGQSGMNLTKAPREIVICNYTIKKGQAFVVPDIKGSPLFQNMPMAQVMGYGFYAAAPLCTSDGFAIGTICVVDFVSRKDFTIRKQKQLTAFAAGFMRHLELRRLKMLNTELNLEKERLHKRLISNKEAPPNGGEATFVCTDVENSTPLWEHHSAEMNQALQLHDQVIRACLSECYGYEIGTEGDSFEVAFHNAVEAVRWCLIVQERLVSLSWPQNLINSEYSKEVLSKDGRVLFRGLRVRMAVHSSSEYECSLQKVSQRLRYFGAGINATRTLSAFANGGQILVSDSSFELINGSLDNLGNPFIIDLGRHSIERNHLEMNVYQLLPPSLGPKFRSSSESKVSDETIEGRTFPMLKTFKILSPSYFDAPQKGILHQVFAVLDKHTRATIVASSSNSSSSSNPSSPTVLSPPSPFSPTSPTSSSPPSPSSSSPSSPTSPTIPASDPFSPATRGRASVAKAFAELLDKHKGYICHEEHGSFMLAFHTAFSAASWCVDTMDLLKDPNMFADGYTPTVQMGVNSGKFEECRPHPVTGRMYYFGALVNRTARIAHKAEDGQILVSKETILELQQTTSAAMKKVFLVQEEGEHRLKGVPVPVSICSIIRRPPGK